MKPNNAIPVLRDGAVLDDSGKRVVVNSVGGPSWPDDVWCRAVTNEGGTVRWGPCQLWYQAQAKTETKIHGQKKMQLKPKRFVTEPYWCVHLDDYDLDIYFVAKELTFQ